MIELSPALLGAVTKPARYTGGEVNAVVKDHAKVDCTFALALPDVYEVGMSNLGLKILYEILNDRVDTAAERVYAPWTDMESEMRARGIPLYSLETFTPIAEFDLFGFSLQYEMIYSNVLQMLDLAGIPLYAAERGDTQPFVVGGGPCVYNPEPVADFFDFFVIGEGEEIVGEIVDVLVAWKKEGRDGGRKGFLRRVAAVEGIYVPSLYEAVADGEGQRLAPLCPEAPAAVRKRVVKDLDAAPFVTKPVVPFINIVHDRIMLELFRGCTRGCRFCQAGVLYRPVRERKPETLLKLAKQLVDHTGYNEMSLTSLSSADYSCLPELVDELLGTMKEEGVSVSLPSLRVDSFSIDLAERLQQVRKSGLTFAPEAGTQRLRDVINKGVTEEDLKAAVGAAFRKGWTSVKLYFMMGLPTETDEDIIGIARLAREVVDLYREIKGRRGAKVTVSVSCFVPKPHTPFQWFKQDSADEFRRKQQLLKQHMKDCSIQFNYHDAKTSELEGVFARGDRRLAKVIAEAWRRGARFDGWSEHFKYEVWMAAFAACGIDPHAYNRRERDFAEALPWDHLDSGVRKAFLRREYESATGAALTEDCRKGACGTCGVCMDLGAHVVDWSGERHV